jgi:hypothetical protein
VGRFITRDSVKEDKAPLKIHGKDHIIEWLYFDEHLLPGEGFLTLVSISCNISFLAPCNFNTSVIPPNAYIHPKYIHKSVTNETARDVIGNTTIKTGDDGSSGDDFYEFFYDLEHVDDDQTGRGMLT